MRIDWAIPCRYVESDGGTATIIGAESNGIVVPGFPAKVSVMIAMKLLADESDTAQHVLASQVFGPDMEPVTERAEAPPLTLGDPNPLKPAGWEQHVIIAAAVEFNAGEPGAYTVVMSVDQRTKNVPLVVALPGG